jgi:hypothetical protein
MISNVTEKFSCVECKYFTNIKSSIQRHMKTKKHIEQMTPRVLDIECEHQCLICHKKYNSQSSLWHHKQKCLPSKDDVNAISKVKEEFGCIDCKYSTTNKTSMQKHLTTEKHIEQMKPKILDIEWEHQCLRCLKKCNSQSSLWHHKQICLPPVIKEEKVKHIFQYIYLIQEREFVKNNERVYKIGKTKQPNFNRFKQYSKDSILISQISCLDCDVCEKQLIQIFKLKYLQRTDIGTEYFEGDYNSMTLDIMSNISAQLESN